MFHQTFKDFSLYSLGICPPPVSRPPGVPGTRTLDAPARAGTSCFILSSSHCWGPTFDYPSSSSAASGRCPPNWRVFHSSHRASRLHKSRRKQRSGRSAGKWEGRGCFSGKGGGEQAASGQRQGGSGRGGCELRPPRWPVGVLEGACARGQ